MISPLLPPPVSGVWPPPPAVIVPTVPWTCSFGVVQVRFVIVFSPRVNNHRSDEQPAVAATGVRSLAPARGGAVLHSTVRLHVRCSSLNTHNGQSAGWNGGNG